MKKILLLGAAALLSVSAAFAQDGAIYKTGVGIKAPSELQHEGLYFLKAYNYDRNKEGYVIGLDQNDQFAKFYGGYLKEISEETGTDNIDYIWKIVKANDGETYQGFKIQCLGVNNRCFSKMGSRGEAWNNLNSTTSLTDENTGIFELEELEEGAAYNKNDENVHRFRFRITNAKWSNPNSGDRNISPCLNSNGSAGTGEENVAYWEYDSGNKKESYIQFEIIPAIAQQTVNITFTLPDINGIAVATQTVSAPLGESPKAVITEQIASLNLGGFKIESITSDQGEKVIAANQAFTVTGSWERQFTPYNVYRLRINPNADAEGAIRYMISTGEIETRREGKETLTRLVPERLWYFEPVEDDTESYYLRTLYDTEAAIYYAATDNGAHAALSKENATKFKFVARPNGGFVLKFSDITAYVNDWGGGGFMSVYNGNNEGDNGCQMRLYPITDDDFAILADFGTEAQLEAAKAAPTCENVKPLIDAYNAVNLEAALKRVSYILGTGMIGNNPGQYSDSNNEFATAVEYAREINAKEDATEEEITTAINGIDIAHLDIDDLSFNDIKPGTFYRLKNKSSNKYLSALAGGTAAGHNVMMLTDDATRSNTVFYFVANNAETATTPETIEYTIVAYENGLCLPKLGTTGGESWMPAHKDETTASHEIKFSYQNNGAYVIHTSGTGDTHRHLHGGGSTGNAGGGTDATYQWNIERVTTLPITLYNLVNIAGHEDDGWASVYSPVALEVTAESHLTAYTGVFDGNDYSGKLDINHIHATEIPAVDGKVIIPANQPTLLYYDGNGEPSESLLTGREHISYIDLNIVENAEASEKVGNLSGSIFAVNPEDGKEYYTLHETYSNNFREYLTWDSKKYDVVPGFKAYIENTPDGISAYPIYLINPNTMVALDGEDGYKISKNEAGEITITVTTPSAEYDVYYKQTSVKTDMNRVADHTGYTLATKEGNVHTMSGLSDGNVEYYAYHAPTDFMGVVRTANVDTTNISEITAEGSAEKVYDLQGRKLAAPAKGINIVNGKKMLVK